MPDVIDTAQVKHQSCGKSSTSTKKSTMKKVLYPKTPHPYMLDFSASFCSVHGHSSRNTRSKKVIRIDSSLQNDKKLQMCPVVKLRQLEQSKF